MDSAPGNSKNKINFLRIFLALSSGFLLLLVTAILLGWLYSDEVKKYVVTSVNRHLNTKISVKEINFSLLKKFPSATVEFSGVTAKDAFTDSTLNTGTLLIAEKINLQFNIIDIFQKNYRIKEITIENGELNIRKNKSGNNLNFWKSGADDKSAGVELALKKVLLENINLTYTDAGKKQQAAVKVRQAELQGNFTSEVYSLSMKSSLFADSIAAGEIKLLHRQPVSLSGTLDVNTRKGTYNIYETALTIAEMNFDVAGEIKSNEKVLAVDVSIDGNNLDIKTVLSLLPEKYRAYVKDYRSEGNFYFNSTLTGEMSDKSGPAFKAEFGVTNGSVYHDKSSVTLKDINLKGHYSSGKESSLQTNLISVDRFSARLGRSTLAGDFIIKNFIHPVLTINTVSEINLEEIKKFLPLDTLAHLAGNVKINASLITNLNSEKDNNLSATRTSGNLAITDASLKLRGKTHGFHNLNGYLLFNDNDIIVNALSGNVAESDFFIKGFFRNIIGYFMDGQRMVIDADFNSDHINLDELLEENASAADTASLLAFSQKAHYYLNARIADIKYKRLEGKNISGRIIIKDKKLLAENISATAMDGNITLTGMIDDANPREMTLTGEAGVKNINIQKLFYQMNNFGQEVLQDRHLRGAADAGIQFIAALDERGNLLEDKLYALAEIKIGKGELMGFEPMKELSRFVKVSELEYIRFGALSNAIEIKNRKIAIPKMEVQSSALSLTLSGTHDFDDNINYRFKILLSELLAQKAKQAKKENTDYAVIEEEDGKGKMALFLSMTGTVDDPKFSYDKIGAKEKAREDVAAEKKLVKSLLKEEFGIFKSDTSLKTAPRSKPTSIGIEWEEADKPREQPKTASSKLKKKEKTKFDKMMDKISVDEKEQYEEVE